MSTWLVQMTVLLVCGTVIWWYFKGWWRLRQAASPLGNVVRLVMLLSSMALIVVTFYPPLYAQAHQFLYMRAIQKILIAMIAAPCFWLAAPVHVILRGMPFSWRRAVIHRLRKETRSGQFIRAISAMGVAWLTYVAAIVIWHDSHVVDWTMTGSSRHYLTLTFVFGAALLYWVHIVGTGLRLRRALPVWVLFAYAVGVEIPNMTAGITIAYSSAPLYTHYTEIARAMGLDIISTQIMAGGLVWFMGSVVFFFSAVMVINRIFLHHGSTQPEYYPEWDSDDRMIAPGLENRVKK